MWNIYVQLYLLATICNLLSGYMDGYNFTGSIILLIALSIILFFYEVCLAPGPEKILTKPISQMISFHDFEQYNKELASFLLSKSNIDL